MFELAAIEARLAAALPAATQRRNGELEIWLPPLKGKEYLVAVDPAGGGSEGDYSAAEVLDLETGLQCAEFAGHVGGLELARLVTELAGEYNQAWLVVERNNHGSGGVGDGRSSLQVSADLSAGGAAGVADHLDEPAGGAGAAGCRAGGAAGAVYEPAAAGGVQELCARGGREYGGAGGHARRPGDGDGDRAGRTGGTAGRTERAMRAVSSYSIRALW